MQKKILIVDDEPDMRELLTVRLTSEGFDVITASDGKEGLECIKAQRPDLIILDAMMPEMNGVEFSESLKKDKENKDIPIILLSGIVFLEGRPGTDNIANLYVAKPFDGNKLVSQVRSLLDKA